MPDRSLDTYSTKRDFARTPEPGPDRPESRRGPLTFVVQKHAARRLHYDLRLEVDGVLKSWAIPKGPSLDPQEKRLAALVEDHPLDYAAFEGVIPQGEYGAGQVIVWDSGTYSPDEGGAFSFDTRAEAEDRVRRSLEQGKLSITLRGQKLRGSWALVRMARGENNWLLIKHRDAYADPDHDITAEDRSVVSGLTVEDLKLQAAQSSTLQQLGQPAPAQEPRRAGRMAGAPSRSALSPQSADDLPGARRAPFPKALSPMLPTLTEGPFSHPKWVFEPKLDGIRALALIHDGVVKLLSRRGLDATSQFPVLAEELAGQPASGMVLDGEIVATDEEGRPSFELLQGRLNLTRREEVLRAEAQIPVIYYVFDLLYLDGFDLLRSPLESRKALLRGVLAPSDRVRYVEHFAEDGEAAYAAATANGLEGVIAKRRDSVYETAKRSGSWLKVKRTLSDDFVIGGYTQGTGGRARTLGALLLGSYAKDGRLVSVGNVGTGFDDRTLVELRRRLDELRTEESPFASPPEFSGPATWVRPELVAEVKFAQRTRDGLLREPVFLRLREDKPPADALAGEVAPVPAPPIPTFPREGGRGRGTSLLPARPDAVGTDSSPGAENDKEVEAVLHQLDDQREKMTLEVSGHRIPLNNLGKELWPATGKLGAISKRDFLVYLARVAPSYLAHLRDRPLSLIRFPNGIGGQHFFQKHSEHPLPPFVETVRIFSEHNEADGEFLLCNNLATLLWLGQLATLELHSWYSRVSADPDGHHLPRTFTGSVEPLERSLLNYPDFIVFDLDPYVYSGHEAKGAEPELNRKAFAMTCEVALWLKEALDALSLQAFAKTSGRTGLHIYVPVLRQLNYDAIRSASQTVGKFVMSAHPQQITMEWTVKKRTGKVFLDHNQNVRGKTLASVYSPRAAPEASVSMPVRWDELGHIFPTDFTIRTAPDRLREVGDLWAGILDAKQDLQRAIGS